MASVADYAALGIVSIIGIAAAYLYFNQKSISAGLTTAVAEAGLAADKGIATAEIALPISSQIGAANAKNGIVQGLNGIQGSNPEYANAKVVTQLSNVTDQQAINAMAAGTPTIWITPSGTNTFGGSPKETGSTLGSDGNPFLYANGWQGAGYYKGMFSASSPLIYYFNNKTEYLAKTQTGGSTSTTAASWSSVSGVNTKVNIPSTWSWD